MSAEPRWRTVSEWPPAHPFELEPMARRPFRPAGMVAFGLALGLFLAIVALAMLELVQPAGERVGKATPPSTTVTAPPSTFTAVTALFSDPHPDQG